VLDDFRLQDSVRRNRAIVGSRLRQEHAGQPDPRFYDPIGGSARLDGIDLRSVRSGNLRRQIAWCPQKALLYEP